LLLQPDAVGSLQFEECQDSRTGYSNIEAVEMTAADLKSHLTPDAVTDLVMASIKSLPLLMPKTFRNSYTPIAAAGTDAQVSVNFNRVS
jgi:symplekin